MAGARPAEWAEDGDGNHDERKGCRERQRAGKLT